MSKHTPGPWIAVGQDIEPTIGHAYGSFDGFRNASLIAAAPELLNALQRMVRWHGARERDDHGGGLLPPDMQPPPVAEAMRAIEKATGELPK